MAETSSQRRGVSVSRIVYQTSDGSVTRRFYRALKERGPWGDVAAALFKAQKASKRAKKYGPVAGVAGSSYRDLSYQRKAEALAHLCTLLEAKIPDWAWGWKEDGASGLPPWVLYVEIPQGQVSFHSNERFSGPDYKGKWDGMRGYSEERIILFCDFILSPDGDIKKYVHRRAGDAHGS
jgi:hypothetical protein